MQRDGVTRAVFVDPTGRRSRIVARACWAVGALLVAYVALVVVSLLLPPGLSRLTVPGLGPVLPGPAAAVLGAEERPDAGPPEVLLAPSRSPRPSATPPPLSAPPRPLPSLAPSPRTVPQPAPAASPAPARSPRPERTAAPGSTRTPGPPVRPTTEPTRQAAKPSPAAGGSSRGPKPRPSATRGPR